YGEDVEFWVGARDAGRGDFDAWAKTWCLDITTHDEYLARVGRERLEWLRARTDPLSWQADADACPIDEDAPVTPWEPAATWARPTGGPPSARPPFPVARSWWDPAVRTTWRRAPTSASSSPSPVPTDCSTRSGS